jgi:hypothetical protein
MCLSGGGIRGLDRRTPRGEKKLRSRPCIRAVGRFARGNATMVVMLNSLIDFDSCNRDGVHPGSYSP